MRTSRLPIHLLLPLVLIGCSRPAPVPCPTVADSQDPVTQHEHSARVAASERAPAEGASQAEKGPSPEGVEAIALLGKQVMDAQRGTCQPQEDDKKPLTPPPTK